MDFSSHTNKCIQLSINLDTITGSLENLSESRGEMPGEKPCVSFKQTHQMSKFVVI